MLWACLDGGAISELDLCRTHFLWQVAPWQPWLMNGLLLSRLIHVFSWVHFSPASLTPGLLQGQECERLRWHYGWMESSRVIMLSERNTIHFKQKTSMWPYFFHSILDQFQVIYEDVVKATFLASVIHQSESSPADNCSAQSNYQGQANDTHIPQPGGSHWPLTTSAWAASWFPSQ